MCSKKEYFDEFQGGKFVTVPIDGMPYCDVMVIGMVKIKMFDVRPILWMMWPMSQRCVRI